MRWNVLVSTVTAATRHTLMPTIYKQGTQRGGRWEEASQLQQQCAVGSCSVLCARHWLLAETLAVLPAVTCCTLAYKFPPNDNAKGLLMPPNVECTHSNRLKQNQPAPPIGRLTDWPTATIHLHWCHITNTVANLESLGYCSTLGGASDRDHWSLSAVDDVTIIDHFVKWSRQALRCTADDVHIFQFANKKKNKKRRSLPQTNVDKLLPKVLQTMSQRLTVNFFSLNKQTRHTNCCNCCLLV